MRPFLRLENEQKSCAIWVYSFLEIALASPVPFITLPLGATEDRVLGTLDLQQALKGAQRIFQSGLLA